MRGPLHEGGKGPLHEWGRGMLSQRVTNGSNAKPMAPTCAESSDAAREPGVEQHSYRAYCRARTRTVSREVLGS